jgi:type IV secretion system protein VirB11
MRHGARTLRLIGRSFDRFLANPGTTDIVVNRPGEIGVECHGTWSWHEAPDLTFERLDAMAILAGFQMGKDIDESAPILDTNFPMAEGSTTTCRLAICRPPATEPGTIVLAIRRPPAHARSLDDGDIAGMFAETNEDDAAEAIDDTALLDLYRAKRWQEFLKLAVRSKKTIGAVGQTGSGKTDVLRRLLREIPDDERIVTGEDTAEFGQLRQRNRAALFWGSPAVKSDDLALAFLRLRPDRLIMQEVRGPEAATFVRVAAAGHPGGMTTWHAETEDPFDALVLMVKQHPAAANRDDRDVLKMLRRYIDIIVFCKRSHGAFSIPKVWFKAAEDAHVA